MPTSSTQHYSLPLSLSHSPPPPPDRTSSLKFPDRIKSVNVRQPTIAEPPPASAHKQPAHAQSFTNSWWKTDRIPAPAQAVPDHADDQEDEDNDDDEDDDRDDASDYRSQHNELPRSDMSRRSDGSEASPSVFDHAEPMDAYEGEYMHPHDQYTQPTSRDLSTEEPAGSYDLKPPPPTAPLSNIELLAERLFSVDHLRLIMRDSTLFARFSNFLNKYRPHAAQSLSRYLDTQKAITAVDYANAIAEKLHAGATAALLDNSFEAHARNAVEDLINDALPGFVTHRLVLIVTEALVKEITGQNTPIMRELVHGLAEVYCLTDPSLPDNPIVYASEGETGSL